MNNAGRRVLFLRTDPANFDPRILKETGSLSVAGYDVTVFGWDRSSQHPREEVVGGVRFRRSQVPAPYGSKLLLFLLPFYWIHALAFARSFRPHVVHACDMDALVPALAVKLLFGPVIVYDIFDHYADKISGIPEFVRGMIRRIDGSLARRADLILVTDDHRRNLLPDTGGVTVEIIMNVPPLAPLRDVRRPAPGRVKVCYAGVIHEHRGLRLIAEAVDGVEGIDTVFAGWIPRPADREFLLGQKKISYIGKVPYAEAMKLIAESDILLALYDPAVPINRVASSNKVFEAMSAGIPVISNDETTMAGIISGHDCGVTVPYGDVARLREAIVRLRDQPGIRSSMGANGNRAYREKFNWGIMERRLLGAYAGLASGDLPGGG